MSREKSSRSSYSSSKSRSRSKSVYESRKSRRSSNSPRSHNFSSYKRTRKPEPNTCIGIFGLSKRTTEDRLWETFEKFGEITRVTLIMDRYRNESLGYGFINYRKIESAKDAVYETSGKNLDGRIIRVDFSITKKPHSPTPGQYKGKNVSKRNDYYGRRHKRSKSDSRSRSPYSDRYSRRRYQRQSSSDSQPRFRRRSTSRSQRRSRKHSSSMSSEGHRTISRSRSPVHHRTRSTSNSPKNNRRCSSSNSSTLESRYSRHTSSSSTRSIRRRSVSRSPSRCTRSGSPISKKSEKRIKYSLKTSKANFTHSTRSSSSCSGEITRKPSPKRDSNSD